LIDFIARSDLCVPESTDGFVRSVAGGPRALVVLEQCREEEEHGDRRVDDALVGDVDVCQLLVHRLIERDHRHHVTVRYEPEQT